MANFTSHGSCYGNGLKSLRIIRLSCIPVKKALLVYPCHHTWMFPIVHVISSIVVLYSMVYFLFKGWLLFMYFCRQTVAVFSLISLVLKVALCWKIINVTPYIISCIKASIFPNYTRASARNLKCQARCT